MPSPSIHVDTETELLLRGARTALEPDAVERIRALAREVDWDRLAHLAQRHRVMPLLLRSLRDACPTALPPAVLARMQHAHRASARRSFLLAAELGRLLLLLNGHGIRVLPLKGPTLAAAVYGDLYLRETRDLDLLLPRADLPRARDLLLSDGYAPCEQASGAPDARLLEHGYHCALTNPNRRALVELHWRFAPAYFSFPLSFEDAWCRRQPLEMNRATLPALSPEDLLLVLCVHTVKHLWKYECALAWVCDISELIRRHPDLDWAAVTCRALDLGVVRILRAGVLLAADLLDAPAPAALLRHARRSGEVRWMVAYALARLFGADESMPQGTSRHVFYLKSRERLPDRLRYAVHLAKTPDARRDRWRLPLPALVSICHYISQPIARPLRRIPATAQPPVDPKSEGERMDVLP